MAKKTAAAPVAVKQLIVTADSLNVRDTPSIQGTILGALKKGQVVTWSGTSGDQYWFKIDAGALKGWASHKYLQPVVPAPTTSSFPWFAIAEREIGVKEVVGSGDNPRIVEYLRSTNLDAPSASEDETPWCSAFANWCVEASGYAGTDSAWARSWLNWGQRTTTPKVGSIVVFSRGVSSGHVAFFVSRTATQIKVLGGNQSDSVCIQNYPASRLLGFRDPI